MNKKFLEPNIELFKFQCAGEIEGSPDVENGNTDGNYGDGNSWIAGQQ